MLVKDKEHPGKTSFVKVKDGQDWATFTDDDEQAEFQIIDKQLGGFQADIATGGFLVERDANSPPA